MLAPLGLVGAVVPLALVAAIAPPLSRFIPSLLPLSSPRAVVEVTGGERERITKREKDVLPPLEGRVFVYADDVAVVGRRRRGAELPLKTRRRSASSCPRLVRRRGMKADRDSMSLRKERCYRRVSWSPVMELRHRQPYGLF